MSTEASHPSYGQALYHPHIHIRNVDWLKSALLYWDDIRRIVPDKFPADKVDPDLDAEVRELLIERPKLLPRTSPTKYVDRAFEKFLDCAHSFESPSTLNPKKAPANPLFAMVAQAHQRLTGKKEINQGGLKKLLGDLLSDSKGVPEVDMWDSKMRTELSALLKAAGLLREDPKGYVLVQKAAADLYMICLATVMSESIWAPPITYRPDYADVGKYLEFGSLQPEKDHVGMLLELELPFPSPEELHQIPLMKVLDIHDRTENERRKLREAVDELMREGSKAREDEYRYEGFLSDKKKQLTEEFSKHRAKMESLTVKSVGSFLKISAPTAIIAAATSVAKSLGFEVDSFLLSSLAGTGMTLSGLAWWGEVKQQRSEAVQDFPYHYLLTLPEELKKSKKRKGRI